MTLGKVWIASYTMKKQGSMQETILEILLSDFQKMQLSGQTQIFERRRLRISVVDLWSRESGGRSSPEAKGYFIFKEQNDANHEICITHNHIIATMSIKYG